MAIKERRNPKDLIDLHPNYFNSQLFHAICDENLPITAITPTIARFYKTFDPQFKQKCTYTAR